MHKPIKNVDAIADLLNQAKAGNTSAKEKLMLSFVGIGTRIASTYAFYWKTQADVITSAMYYGIVEAFRDVDKLYPEHLVSYVVTYVKASIRDALRDTLPVHIPRDMHEIPGFVRLDDDDEDGKNKYVLSTQDDLSHLIVRDLLNQLPEREAKIIEMRMSGYSLKEIGQTLGISTGRVFQILKGLEAKLRRYGYDKR